MSNISFGGLASGLDTSKIIDTLLGIERQSIERLEAQKVLQTAKFDASKKFDSALDTLLTKVGVLSMASTLRSQAATTSSGDFLTATASGSAASGTYEIKVGRLAQVEKAVYAGVADKDTTTFGTGTLVLNNDALASPVNIAIDGSNNTLQGIRDAINAGSTDHGVSASIVNDGSGTPYRLVLTGKTVDNANITLDASGLAGGTGVFPAKDLAVSRTAQTALIQVDGITITSDTNTLSEAISGVTIDLTHADPAFDPLTPNWAALTGTTLKVATDTQAMQGKIEEFVTAFNAAVSAAGDQSLAGDSTIRSVLANLRRRLTDSTTGTGLFKLGITSQKDGTIQINSAKLTEALTDDEAGVGMLLAGDGVTEGIADLLKTSLSGYTSATTGFLAARQKSYDATIHRIDKEIARDEIRVAFKEEQLTAQFAALESLVNALNSQGNYLTQQMNLLSGGNN